MRESTLKFYSLESLKSLAVKTPQLPDNVGLIPSKVLEEGEKNLTSFFKPIENGTQVKTQGCNGSRVTQ